MNPVPQAPNMTDEEHRLLDELVSDRFGISFRNERRTILESRLRPRLQALQLASFMDYYLQLQYAFEQEAPEFIRLLTNNETYFFRETTQFEALLEDAWHDIAAGLQERRPLRVLCAGCSSGEEPFTLAIMASEAHPPAELSGFEIDAFDIDARRLEIARGGEYGQSALRTTNEDQIRRYFQRTGSNLFSLNSRYRTPVRFSYGNILDPATYPGTGYDVVFCRNVLIYFSEDAIHRAIANFAAVLRPGGLLFVGHAESIIGLSTAFETVRFERCIAYRRKR